MDVKPKEKAEETFTFVYLDHPSQDVNNLPQERIFTSPSSRSLECQDDAPQRWTGTYQAKLLASQVVLKGIAYGLVHVEASGEKVHTPRSARAIEAVWLRLLHHCIARFPKPLMSQILVELCNLSVWMKRSNKLPLADIIAAPRVIMPSSDVHFLVLHPSRDDEAIIKCTLCRSPLQENIIPKYEVVVLAGSEDEVGSPQSGHIELNGAAERVSLELQIMLRHMRSRNSPRVLWIGELCSNVPKTQSLNQISQEAYCLSRNSKTIIVWLGVETASSRQAVAFLQNLGVSLRLCFAYRNFWHSVLLHKLVNGPDHSSDWLAVSRLLRKQWWAQAEFYLDFMNPARTFLHCGSDSLSLRTFLDLFVVIRKAVAVLDFCNGSGFFFPDSVVNRIISLIFLEDLGNTSQLFRGKVYDDIQEAFKEEFGIKGNLKTTRFSRQVKENKVFHKSKEVRVYTPISTPRRVKLVPHLLEIQKNLPRGFLTTVDFGHDLKEPEDRVRFSPPASLREEIDVLLDFPLQWWLRRRQGLMASLMREGYELENYDLVSSVQYLTPEFEQDEDIKLLLPPLRSLQKRPPLSCGAEAKQESPIIPTPERVAKDPSLSKTAPPPASIYDPLIIYPSPESGRLQIRLLTILPAHNYDDIIECRMFGARLDSNLHFTALSYAWGDERVTNPIRVNGRPFNATTNLVDALLHLRASGKPAILQAIWIDAICINQKNVLEKNHQVKHMGSIYRGAKQVVSWLGPESNGSGTALLFIQTVAQLLREVDFQPQEFIERIRLLLDYRKKGAFRKTAVDNLTHLLKRQFLYRGWVFQESYLAHKRFLVCGHDWINAEDLELLTRATRTWKLKPMNSEPTTSSSFSTSPYNVLGARGDDIDQSPSKNQLFTESHFCLADAEAMECPPLEKAVLEPTDTVNILIPTLQNDGCPLPYPDSAYRGTVDALLKEFDRFFRTALISKKPSIEKCLVSGNSAATRLSYLLIFTLRLQVTNPRDKIYSLLAITETDIEVDYRCSVADLYCSVAHHFFVFPRSLSDVGLHALPEVERTAPDLPSWVPDFHAISKRIRIDPFFKTIDAAKGLDFSPKLSVQGRRLHISGFQVPIGLLSGVFFVDNSKALFRAFGCYLVSSGEFHPNGLTSLQALLYAILDHRSTLSMGFTSDPEENLEFKDLRIDVIPFYTILMELAEDIWKSREENHSATTAGISSRVEFRRLFEASLGTRVFDVDPSAWNVPVKDQEFRERLNTDLTFWDGPSLRYRLSCFSFSRYYFFYTSSGYFGFAQFPVEAGDVFFIFPGFDDLLVLRKQGKQSVLLGKCWVLGFMEGEIKSHWEQGKTVLERIEMV